MFLCMKFSAWVLWGAGGRSKLEFDIAFTVLFFHKTQLWFDPVHGWDSSHSLLILLEDIPRVCRYSWRFHSDFVVCKWSYRLFDSLSLEVPIVFQESYMSENCLSDSFIANSGRLQTRGGACCLSSRSLALVADLVQSALLPNSSLAAENGGFGVMKISCNLRRSEGRIFHQRIGTFQSH